MMKSYGCGRDTELEGGGVVREMWKEGKKIEEGERLRKRDGGGKDSRHLVCHRTGYNYLFISSH